MSTWGMVFDLRRCIGCNACAVACKQENTLPNGVFFTKTLTVTTGEYPNVTKTYVPTLCNHCEEPPCERVCPTGATYVRPDGIVMVESNDCIGCGTCVIACPYDTRTILEGHHLEDGLFGGGQLTAYEKQGLGRFTKGTTIKCTFCHDRVDGGLDPACVVTCPTEARIFGDLDDPNSAPSRLIRQHKGRQPLPEKNTRPRVYYIG